MLKAGEDYIKCNLKYQNYVCQLLYEGDVLAEPQDPVEQGLNPTALSQLR